MTSAQSAPFMQCPRCGAANRIDVRACIRCGLPAYGPPAPPVAPPVPPPVSAPPGPPPQGYQPQPYQAQPYQPQGYQFQPYQSQPYQSQPYQPQPYQPQPYPREPYPRRTDARLWSRAGVLATSVACVVSLVYAVYALTARRAVYASLGGASGATFDQAKTSDRHNEILLTVALVVAVVGVAVWIAVAVWSGRGRNVWGLAGLGAVVVGAVLGGIGDVIVSGVDAVADSGRGADATVAIGLGFVVAACGFLLGALSVRVHDG